MAGIHYKLPLDDEIDKDIIDWIDNLPRMKKGEMVRHAIRYYMAVLGEGEMIKFPNASNTVVRQSEEKALPDEPKKTQKEKVRPVFNPDAIKGKSSNE